MFFCCFFFFKQKTAYEMRISDWSSDVCSSDLCEVWWNGGAFADIGPRVTQKSGFTAAGPYDIENVSIDSYQIYTNLPPAGAFRGFGITQMEIGRASCRERVCQYV